MKPQDWMAHMERKRNELENAGHEMDDESFLAHTMASLPQEEYQTTIFCIEGKTKRRCPNNSRGRNFIGRLV